MKEKRAEAKKITALQLMQHISIERFKINLLMVFPYIYIFSKSLNLIPVSGLFSDLSNIACPVIV